MTLGRTTLAIACAFALVHCAAAEIQPLEDYEPSKKPSSTKKTSDASEPAPSSTPSGTPVPPTTPAPTVPMCDPSKPFQTPARVAGLDPQQAFMRPKLSADELTIYFTMRVNDVPKLARATRASRTDPFGAITRISEVESNKSDRDPSVSTDQMTLVFSSTRSGEENLFVATRSAPTSAWGQPLLVPTVNTKSDERDPYLRASSSELWFSSPRAGTWEIYVAPFMGTSGADAPRLVTELISPTGASYQPMITEDGLAIVFVSERAGGKGNRDLWIARRTATTLPFSAPTPIAEVNTAADENGVWLSPDGCRLYFSSDRGSDHDSLFVAERTL